MRGLENIPKNKPVLFAVNHQNAFMDGILVDYQLKRPVYFLTRSDVFKGKWIVVLFRWLNLVPIFRKQDGESDLRQKNQETFTVCIDALSKNKAVLIFPEGQSIAAHHLFPLKKGVGRLAFEAEEQNNFNLGLHIVPVAINYQNHFVGGHNVYINFLDSIIVEDYKAQYIQNKARATNNLVQTIESNLRNRLVDIDGDYVKFRRKYWRGIIRQSRNDVEIIAAIKSIPREGDEFSMKGHKWKSEKFKYLTPRSPINKIGSFLICLPGIIVFLPTIILTKLIVFRIKDEDFYLSTVAMSWLLLGLTQLVITAIYLWTYVDMGIFLSSIAFQIGFGLVALKNHIKFR